MPLAAVEGAQRRRRTGRGQRRKNVGHAESQGHALLGTTEGDKHPPDE